MAPRRSKSRPPQASQLRSATPGSPDFNLMWRSKDLAQLGSIPHNLQGWCGCSICGSMKIVKGSVFRQHMWELYSTLPSQPSTSKRLRLSSLPSQAHASTSTPLAPPTSVEPSTDLSIEQEPVIANDFMMEGGYEADEEGVDMDVDTDNEHLDDTALHARRDGDEDMQDLEQLLAGSSLLDIAPGPSPSPSPSPAPSDTSTGAKVDTRSTSYGRNQPLLTWDDHIASWPHPLPTYLLPPPASGSLPNPFAAPPSASYSLPLSSQILPLLAHTLSGLANIPRRSIELVLQTASLLVAHTRKHMYQRFRTWYINSHPTADQAVIDDLDEQFAPGLGDPVAAPKTAATAFKQLHIDDALVVHPVCRNHDCNHVFLEFVTQKAFVDLPPLCPSCEEPLMGLDGTPDVLHFPRRTLQSELEVLFRVPGVENAIERRKERKAQRDELDRAAGMKIYRQQDDGFAWVSDSDGEKGTLSVSVNFSIDWANPSSSRSAAASSMGPFLLQVADLPPQLRGAFCCMLIMGITPAPRQPKAANLWKFLLPLALELRDAGSNGVWVRTPAFPEGRLVKVRLACLVCDRPAAVETTGGPYFGAKATPCLRCHANQDDLPLLKAWPRRHYDKHFIAVTEQLVRIPQAVRRDMEDWASEPPFDPVTGERKAARYRKDRREAVIKANTTTRGHISAFALIPGLDLFRLSVFDPMHAILEGCVKTYFFKVMQLGAHNLQGQEDGVGGSTDGGGASQSEGEQRPLAVAGSILKEMRDGGVPQARPPEVIDALEKDLERLGRATKGTRKLRMRPGDISFMQGRIATTQTPSSIQRLHPAFGTPTAGSPTAHDWRVFSTVFAPLCLPLMFKQRGPRPGHVGNAVFSSAELRTQMILCEITSLALRPTISEPQIKRLESLILEWQKATYALHPTLKATTNIHVISHLASDIQAYGPTFGWWCFPGERLNYVVKNTNRSGGSHYQAQVVAMRAVVRSREVISTRARTLRLGDDASQEDSELAGDVKNVLDGFQSQSAGSTLEQIAYMYAEIDKRDLESISDHSTERVVVRRRGAIKEGTLDRGTLRRLQDCLRLHNIETSTSAASSTTYISSQVKFWEGIIINGRRLDCADWLNVLLLSPSPQQLADLTRARNSVFEARPESDRWSLRDQNSRSGILCAIFEHKLSVCREGEAGSGLYGVVRLFKPYKGDDIYGYRQHPSLDVWTWQHQALDEVLLIALRPEILQAMRSLALVSLPIDPLDETRGQIWATIPLE